MKKTILAAALALCIASPASAATHYLVRHWIQGGNQFCEYSNGTILNVGYRVCPSRIEG